MQQGHMGNNPFNRFSQVAANILIASSLISGTTGAIASAAPEISPTQPPPSQPQQASQRQPESPEFLNHPSNPNQKEFFLKAEGLSPETLNELIPYMKPGAPVTVILDDFTTQGISYLPFKGALNMAFPASHGEMVRAAFLSRLGENTPENIIYIDFGGTTGSNGTGKALTALADNALPIDVLSLSRSPGRYNLADLRQVGITPDNIRDPSRPIPEFPNDVLGEGYSSATEAVTAWATPLKRLYTERRNAGVCSGWQCRCQLYELEYDG